METATRSASRAANTEDANALSCVVDGARSHLHSISSRVLSSAAGADALELELQELTTSISVRSGRATALHARATALHRRLVRAVEDGRTTTGRNLVASSSSAELLAEAEAVLALDDAAADAPHTRDVLSTRPASLPPRAGEGSAAAAAAAAAKNGTAVLSSTPGSLVVVEAQRGSRDTSEGLATGRLRSSSRDEGKSVAALQQEAAELEGAVARLRGASGEADAYLAHLRTSVEGARKANAALVAREERLGQMVDRLTGEEAPAGASVPGPAAAAPPPLETAPVLTQSAGEPAGSPTERLAGREAFPAPSTTELTEITSAAALVAEGEGEGAVSSPQSLTSLEATDEAPAGAPAHGTGVEGAGEGAAAAVAAFAVPSASHPVPVPVSAPASTPVPAPVPVPVPVPTSAPAAPIEQEQPPIAVPAACAACRCVVM
jgi:hypothetical protein